VVKANTELNAKLDIKPTLLEKGGVKVTQSQTSYSILTDPPTTHKPDDSEPLSMIGHTGREIWQNWFLFASRTGKKISYPISGGPMVTHSMGKKYNCY